MEVGERYSKLLELARENSSDKRRELLTDVTSLFFSNKDNRSDIETNMFGELMAKVAYELDVEVRKELSTRFCKENAPRRLIVALANDTELSIAEPVLRNSHVLTQSDLIAVVETRGDAHRLLVTKRPDVSEALSAALVAFGNDHVVESLIQNETANVSRETYDKMVDRAIVNPFLQGPLIQRQSISPEHLNKMFFNVDTVMRAKILERNAQFSEEEIDQAIASAKTRIAVSHGALPSDYENAKSEVDTLHYKNMLLPQILPALWRDNKKTKFILAFAQLTGLNFHQSAQLLDRKDIDGLAMVSRAAGFERVLFVTIAVLVLNEGGMGKAKLLGEMYNEVPQEAAQRALRFMKLRAGALAEAA